MTHTAKFSAANAATDSEQNKSGSTSRPVYKHSKNGQGRTALHQAMSCGNWDVARVLLHHDEVIASQQHAVEETEGNQQGNIHTPSESNDMKMENDEDKMTSTKGKEQMIRLKDCVDKRGLTALDLSLRRGFSPPADIISLLKGNADEIIGHRDMILDPPVSFLKCRKTLFDIVKHFLK